MRITYTSVVSALGVLLITGIYTVPRAFAQEEKPSDRARLEEQIEKEKRVRQETDQAVRRIATMLSILDFYGIDATERRQVLGGVGKTLSKLNREQMADVINKLSAAADADDPAKSKQEADEAFEKHVEIMRELRKIMTTFDSLRSLEQAAEHLDKLAREQQDICILTKKLNAGVDDKKFNKFDRPDILAGIAKRRATEQQQLELEILSAINDIKGLLPNLPPEHQDRIHKMERRLAEQQFVKNLADIGAKLNRFASAAKNVTNNRISDWRKATEMQQQAAVNMVELAAILRTTGTSLDVLKEAVKKIDEAIANQDALNKETQNAPNLARQLKKVPDLNKAKEKLEELAKDQAKLELDAANIRKLIEPLAKGAADDLADAEKAMRASREALEKTDTTAAAAPQKKASDDLRKIRDELDNRIAQQMKDHDSPIAQLKQLANDLDKIIENQKQTRDSTKDAADKPDSKANQADLARTQEKLANRTDDLRNQPMPDQSKIRDQLDKAAQAMKKAADELEAKSPMQAVPRQDKALDALQQAKKDVNDKINQIEKRLQDIGKLEKAINKLDYLATQEGDVAQEAKDKAGIPMDLSKRQDQITPQTKDLAQDISKEAPDAADKLNQAADKMDAAKNALDEKKLDSAAKNAEDAMSKLDDAKVDLYRQLFKLKVDELNDQAAMKNIDPHQSRDQVAQALKEAKEAAEALQKALDQANTDELANKQQDIAKKAKENKLADMEAARAADNLKKGNLDQAIEEQEKAIKKFNDAAREAAIKPGEGKELPKVDLPQPSQAKNDPVKNEDAATQKPKAPKTPQTQEGEAKPPFSPQGEPKASGMKKAPLPRNQIKPGDPIPDNSRAESKPIEPKGPQPRMDQAKSGGPKPKTQAKNGQPKDMQAKAGDPKGASEPKGGQTKDGQAKNGDLKGGEPKIGQAKAGEPTEGQAKDSGTPKIGQAKDMADLPRDGQAKAGEPQPLDRLAKENPPDEPGQAMPGQAKNEPIAKAAADAKAGEPMAAEAKAPGLPPPGDPKTMAESKAGKLAQEQNDLKKLTQAIAKAKERNEDAQNALGQAMPKAPEGVQDQLKQANDFLQKANQELSEGKAAQAADSQAKANDNLQKALDALTEAAKNVPIAKADPSTMPPQRQPSEAGDNKPGDKKPGDMKNGQPDDKPGNKPGDMQDKGRPDAGKEMNEKNEGGRQGVGSAGAQSVPNLLKSSMNDGNFLSLPPREREMIRQALNGQLPPEYAAEIQQYFINISRGRAAPGTPATPTPPR